MTSPLRRAPKRTSHLSVVSPETTHAPHLDEGFLISDRVYKSKAVIDFTLRAFLSARSDRRTILVPGYGGIKPVYGDFRDAFAAASEGDTASYRQPRTEKGIHALRLDKLRHPDRLGKQSVVAMIDMMRRRYPNQKVTLVGHSMGGPNAVDGALRRIDDVEAIVLLGSGGLEEGQNVVRLGKRFPTIAAVEGRSVLELVDDDPLSVAGQALFHMMRNPWRTGGEAIEIGNRDLMVDEISKLRAHGIGVHAVQLENDSFFPTDIAEKDTRGLVDSLTVIEGLDHVGPQTHPELVAAHIADVLATRRPKYEILDAA